jgi:ribonuclease HI
MIKEVNIYTDGACSGNPGPGGWGAVLISGENKKEIYGSEKITTNNRMELTAAIEALRALKTHCSINLYTDSIYVMKGITEWLKNWKKRDWRGSDNKAIKNQDLWVELDILANNHTINWKWVKGHSGDFYNDLADALAVRGRDEVK